MQVFNRPADFTSQGRKVSLAIGMFDGVHLGHQQVIRQAVADAEQHEGLAVAVTFDRHPNSIVAPDRLPLLIYSQSQKLRALASLGKVTDLGQKAFTEMLLNPTFTITAGDKQIQLDSEYLTYTASDALPVESGLMEAFFAYDELNAYRKAMVIRRTPPFPQLVVSGILKDKAMIPGRLVMEFRTPHGEVQVVTTLSWMPLTPEELAEFKQPRS